MLSTEELAIECLRCGRPRHVQRTLFRHIDDPECPRCGYVGWALVVDLTEAQRRQLRDRPPERRSLRVA